jgi:hypothetical protein
MALPSSAAARAAASAQIRDSHEFTSPPIGSAFMTNELDRRPPERS